MSYLKVIDYWFVIIFICAFEDVLGKRESVFDVFRSGDDVERHR